MDTATAASTAHRPRPRLRTAATGSWAALPTLIVGLLLALPMAAGAQSAPGTSQPPTPGTPPAADGPGDAGPAPSADGDGDDATDGPQPMPAPMPAPVAPPPRPAMIPYAGNEGHIVEAQTNRNGVGFSFGMHPGFGFAYRRYFGNTMLQGSLFAMITNRGEDSTVWAGLSAAQYLLVWHERRGASLLPDTSALRLVGGVSYLYDRTSFTDFSFEKVDPTCVDTLSQPCQTTVKESVQTEKTNFISAGVGIGFEFGAIMRPGFSLSLDLALTAMWNQDGLQQIWPLPALTLMYSW